MGPKRKNQASSNGQNEGSTASASSSKHQKIDTTEEKDESSPQPQDVNLYHGFEEHPASKAYRLIEPGPVLLVATGSLKDKNHNIMTIGFHMVMQHEDPPLIGIYLGRWDASYSLLNRAHGSCTLIVPSVEMIDTVVDIGNCSMRDPDIRDEVDGKWSHFGLEALPPTEILSPLLGGDDIIANIECKVHDRNLAGKYSLWILKVLKVWINPKKKPGEGGKMFHHRGDGTFVVDGEVLDLKDRMVKWEEFQD